MENLGCPCVMMSLSALLVCWYSKGKETQYIWYQFRCRSCRRSVSLITDPPAGLPSGFSFGVDSLSLSYPLGDHKAVVQWGSVHGHQGIFHSPVGLHTAYCMSGGRPPPSPCSSAWGHKVLSFQYRRGEALHKACRRRGYVIAERHLRTLLSFSRCG